MTSGLGPETGRNLLRHGRPEPPESQTPLRAGPVTALLVGPDLRHIRLGGIELLQRIYVAVRDEAWNTIPAEFHDLDVQQDDDGFRVRFLARHRHADIDLEWTGTYLGSADGTIVASMDATANTSFAYAKIGFNLHHGLDAYVGRPFRARRPDGEIDGVLPEAIAPQEIRGGTLTAMFPFFDRLAVDLDGGVQARFAFDGDMFEMQDHRNWSDGNYKTYGTPLAWGYPMQISPGERLRQQITMSFTGSPPLPAAPAAQGRPHRLEIGEECGRLPELGLGMSSDYRPLGQREVRLLRGLAPSHLRAELHLADDGHRAAWDRAVDAARALDTGLELGVFVTSDARDQLDRLRNDIASVDVPVARVIVYEDVEGFSELRGTTPVELVRLAKERLGTSGGDVAVVGGTNQFFVEINRDRPDLSAMDGVAYSLNPQVHAADDLSLFENLGCQADMVEFLRSLEPGVRVHVSPVTLIGRTGPFPAGPPAPDDLPGAVDVRQASLLGAAWTVGSLKHLGEGGAASATYYETCGWRGIIESGAGSPEPFPSEPGDVFPVYHVLADVGERRGARLLIVHADEPLAVDGLALSSTAGVRVLVANMTAVPQQALVGPLPGSQVIVRVLDEATAADALRDPAGYRATAATVSEFSDGGFELDLSPYAVACIDTIPPDA